MTWTANKNTTSIVDLDEIVPPNTNFNGSPVFSLSINRQWARYFISWLSYMATDDSLWTDAERDVAQQRLLTSLSAIINAQ